MGVSSSLKMQTFEILKDSNVSDQPREGNIKSFDIYCGIIIFHGGPIVSLVVNPYSRIYIHTNVNASICLIFIKTIPYMLQTNLRPYEPEKNMATHED